MEQVHSTPTGQAEQISDDKIIIALKTYLNAFYDLYKTYEDFLKTQDGLFAHWGDFNWSVIIRSNAFLRFPLPEDLNQAYLDSLQGLLQALEIESTTDTFESKYYGFIYTHDGKVNNMTPVIAKVLCSFVVSLRPEGLMLRAMVQKYRASFSKTIIDSLGIKSQLQEQALYDYMQGKLSRIACAHFGSPYN